jgi:hypothetical protein
VFPGLGRLFCLFQVWNLDPELGLGIDQGLDPVTDPVMDMNLELGSDLVDLEWALDSDPGLAFSSNSSILVPDSVDAVDALTRGSVGKVVTEVDSKILVLLALVVSLRVLPMFLPL